jgi:alpha-L-fucosidase 2
MGSGFQWLGFSGIWAGIMFARLKNSEKVMECIREMLSKKISQNMLYCSNFGGFNHIFQIDFNYGFAALILEALVQSHTGKVEMLPALPKEWKHGEIRGIKTRTGETVNFKW